jgi:tetratricopeptide (TPR) repeat protein
MEHERPAWAERLRTERESRGWGTFEMARQLRQAIGITSHPANKVKALARQIVRHENGYVYPRDWVTAYAKVFDIPETELRPPPKTNPPQAGDDGGHPSTSPQGGGPTNRRDALKLGAAVAVTPEVLHKVLPDTAAEAMEFTRRANTTAIGHGTFDHLESVIVALDRKYNVDPPADLFSTAHTYRHRVAELIEGPRTLKEARELYVCAAWLSEMLAWLAHCLGEPLAAEAWALDAFHHADQAGHDELCAWACDAMASVAIYHDQPARAVAAARRGVAKAPGRHPLAVHLRTQAARAHARLGDREACEEMFRQARDLHELLPARAPLRLALDTADLAPFAITGHATQAYLWLGDTEQGDFRRAKQHAQAAIDAQLALPARSRSPIREAMAHIDLAIAQAHLGEPEEAAALGQQALTTARRVDPVRRRAEDLHRVLNDRYRKLNAVRDLREAYRQNRPTK